MAKMLGLQASISPRTDLVSVWSPGGVATELDHLQPEAEITATLKAIKEAAGTVAAAQTAKAKPTPAKEQAVATGSIYAKLLRFQSLPLSIHKSNSANLGGRGSYRYADLPSCLEVIRPALADCGLVVVQLVDGDSLLTRIVDASTGEAIESRFHMPLEGLNWHGIGSAISYARRYALLSALSLAPDDDDDAASTLPSQATQAAQKLLNQPARPAETCPDCGSELSIGKKTGRLYCRPCWQAKAPAY